MLCVSAQLLQFSGCTVGFVTEEFFCDPCCRFCTEILHCCAVFLHFELDVCKAMLPFFCCCFEPSLHTTNEQVILMLYPVARCKYSLLNVEADCYRYLKRGTNRRLVDTGVIGYNVRSLKECFCTE